MPVRSTMLALDEAEQLRWVELDRPPLRLPTGVRTASTITTDRPDIGELMLVDGNGASPGSRRRGRWPWSPRAAEGVGGEARGVALVAHQDDATVVRRDGEAVLARRVEAPLEHVAVDHDGAGQRRPPRPVGRRADVDDARRRRRPRRRGPAATPARASGGRARAGRRSAWLTARPRRREAGARRRGRGGGGTGRRGGRRAVGSAPARPTRCARGHPVRSGADDA